MEQPLRQPRTFWQWLTHQEGTLWVPPPPPVVQVGPARSALDAIETAIDKMHEEMENLRDAEYVQNNAAYHKLVDKLGRLHEELIRRSQDEKPQTIPV